MKGALNLAKDVGRDAAKIIIPKSIESTKEPGGDGGSVPAERSKERRWSIGSGDGVQGLYQ